MSADTLSSVLISEYRYKSGLRQRWYTCYLTACNILASVPADKRGQWTLAEPLRTSPPPMNIWRVDDWPGC